MRNFLKTLWSDESGAAGAEYALILALVGVGIATAASGLGDDIVGAFDSACAAITDTAGATC
jgi:pilus assembly protein Flp/PilA